MYAVASYGYFVPQMPSFQSGGEGWTEAEIESFVRWWTGTELRAYGHRRHRVAVRPAALSLSGFNPARVPTAEFPTAGERR
jgi:hypothetical protein